MTNPTSEAQAQWDAACKTMKEEFQLSPHDLPSIDISHALFLQLVGTRVLTQEAANALMYSLYFAGYLSTLSAFKQESPDFEVPPYLHEHPVLEAPTVGRSSPRMGTCCYSWRSPSSKIHRCCWINSTEERVCDGVEFSKRCNVRAKRFGRDARITCKDPAEICGVGVPQGVGNG